MTSLREFLDELARVDVRVWADGETLRCSGPADVVTPELQAQLRARKAEILAFLGQARAATMGGDWTPAPRPGRLPLSEGQERLWRLAELQPASGAYITTTVFRLEGDLDVAAVERSLDELQRRHEILRTSFPSDGGDPVQRIAPPAAWRLPVRDVSPEMRRSPEQREQTLRRLLQAEICRPFDVTAAPPWRAVLLRVGERDHVLSVTTHHIIFDGWSKVVFLRELGDAYRAFSAGQSPEMPPLPLQYADYAIWQRRRLVEELPGQLAYWEKCLGGRVPELRLPRDHARSSATTARGGSRSFEVPAAVADALRQLSRREQATLYMTLLAAFAAWLHRYTEQLDQVVCSPVAARDRPELEGLIGYFNNIVVMRLDLSGDPPFGELIRRVRRVALEAHAHHAVPLQRLAELPNLVRTPLTRGMFAYQDASTRVLDLPGLVATPLDLRKETADFDLALYMESSAGGKLSGVLEYHAELFEEDTVTRMLQDLQVVLASVAESPERRVSQLPRRGDGSGAVERLLAGHPQITEAVVVPDQRGLGPVAYLVLNEDDVPQLDDIRQYLRARVPDYLLPAAFVPLEAVPLTADGAVDRPALPPPRLAERPVGTYAAPRTELERQLADIWQRVLWLDQKVGIHDHFLDLGGHSLLSVQLMLELKTRLGRRLPLEALSEWSTVAELARVLEGTDGPEAPESPGPSGSASPRDEGAVAPPLAASILYGLRTYTASWAGQRATPQSLVIGLNTKGTSPPLFWCLQNYRELKQLAKYVGPDRPVYGMRSGNKVMVKTDANNRALAARYVRDILEIQPEGSFVVGGNCQAASIAFYIATGLLDAGHEVPLLVLMERFVPHPYPKPVALLFGAESDRNPYWRFREPERGWRKYYPGGLTIDIVAGAHGQFFQEPNIQVLAQTLVRRMDEVRGREQDRSPAGRARELQILPPTAYRASLAAPASCAAEPGAELRIPVTVTNVSPDVWRPSEVSGIFVANRWLNGWGRVVSALDGRSPLPGACPPGSSVEVELSVVAPRESGRYILELDLVDEGVAWFKDRGSEAARVRVQVGDRRPRSFLGRLASLGNRFETRHGDERPRSSGGER
ncbi:MAG TPA: condensation domain-containing protein [Methylomirabilota bacterium]|nr:condensation domain-containing protein [Methylomirabilota bacterium]